MFPLFITSSSASLCAIKIKLWSFEIRGSQRWCFPPEHEIRNTFNHPSGDEAYCTFLKSIYRLPLLCLKSLFYTGLLYSINIYAKNHSNDFKYFCISLHIIKLWFKKNKQKNWFCFTNHSSVIFKSFTAVMMNQ